MNNTPACSFQRVFNPLASPWDTRIQEVNEITHWQFLHISLLQKAEYLKRISSLLTPSQNSKYAFSNNTVWKIYKLKKFKYIKSVPVLKNTQHTQLMSTNTNKNENKSCAYKKMTNCPIKTFFLESKHMKIEENVKRIK